MEVVFEAIRREGRGVWSLVRNSFGPVAIEASLYGNGAGGTI